MKTNVKLLLLILAFPEGAVFAQEKNSSDGAPEGYPAAETAQKAYDDADFSRAVQAYRFFYPTVSGLAMFKGSREVGIVENKVFGTLDTQPKHVGYTLNSDTPYAYVLLNLKNGPFVIEIPPGPLTNTRSQIQTEQGKAALRSLFELKEKAGTLYFGPKAPAGQETKWIKTIPGQGWFVYFRIYGPEKSAFDGSWKPGDFEEIKNE